ncbi:MAG: aminoglycoside phosphotransferase family protein [Actinomycetota bacterium]|nr:aminoglycoside phosphotransferase family protein [Actinomycetota bacterium]
MARGDLLARGNTADVLVWSSDTVAKVLHETTPDEWAAHEAATVRLVRDAGLPAPAVRDVTTVAGRPALILERVDGPSMWDLARREPGRIAEVGRALADLQERITAVRAPAGIADLHARLRAKIVDAHVLAPSDRAEALRRLDALPAGDRLCHGDLHPGNVLWGPDGPVVVDWFDASAGHPFADVTRTSLLVRPPSRELTGAPHLPGGSRSMLRGLHDAYLARVVERRGCVGELAAWEPVVAAGRLSEQVPHEDLLGVWQRRGSTDRRVAPRRAAGRPPATPRPV